MSKYLQWIFTWRTYLNVASLILVWITAVNDYSLLNHMVILSSNNLCQLQKKSSSSLENGIEINEKKKLKNFKLLMINSSKL